MGMYPSNLFVMRNQIYILKCLDYFAVIVCVLQSNITISN